MIAADPWRMVLALLLPLVAGSVGDVYAVAFGPCWPPVRPGSYAFTNGVRPDDTPAGPFGFQPDVFDSVPGDDAYRPLRRLIRVSWADDDAARVLTSVGEIREAEQAGEVTVEETSVVINAPMLSWPGASR